MNFAVEILIGSSIFLTLDLAHLILNKLLTRNQGIPNFIVKHANFNNSVLNFSIT